MWIVAYIGVYCVGLMMPLWFFGLCVLGYTFFKQGHPLMIIAVLIDAQFGIAHASMPFVYTLLTAAIVACIELLKPHLSFYTE